MLKEVKFRGEKWYIGAITIDREAGTKTYHLRSILGYRSCDATVKLR